MADKYLHHWGDIDVHGFQTLARLRARYPAAQSRLMDAGTFARYYGGGLGGDFQPAELPLPTAAEQQLYRTLRRTNRRLGQ